MFQFGDAGGKIYTTKAIKDWLNESKKKRLHFSAPIFEPLIAPGVGGHILIDDGARSRGDWKMRSFFPECGHSVSFWFPEGDFDNAPSGRKACPGCDPTNNFWIRVGDEWLPWIPAYIEIDLIEPEL